MTGLTRPPPCEMGTQRRLKCRSTQPASASRGTSPPARQARPRPSVVAAVVAYLSCCLGVGVGGWDGEYVCARGGQM